MILDIKCHHCKGMVKYVNINYASGTSYGCHGVCLIYCYYYFTKMQTGTTEIISQERFMFDNGKIIVNNLIKKTEYYHLINASWKIFAIKHGIVNISPDNCKKMWFKEYKLKSIS